MPKQTKKAVLESQAREFVVRLRDYFEKERENGGPLVSINRVVDRVADALDIGRNTVSKITKEKYGDNSMEENELTTPNTKRLRKSTVTEMDSFDVGAIWNHIHEYYQRKEVPTMFKLTQSLRDAELYNGSQSSLWRLLQKIGFRCNKNDNYIIKPTQESPQSQDEEDELIENILAAPSTLVDVPRPRKTHVKQEDGNTMNKDIQVTNKPQLPEDDFDRYGKILANKLRKLSETESLQMMYDIDGLFIKRMTNPLESSPTYYLGSTSYSEPDSKSGVL